MNREVLKKIPLRPAPFLGWGPKIHWAFFGLFLVVWTLVWVRLWLAPSLFAGAGWPDGALIVVATGTTLATVGRRLPGQNVILASVIIGVIAGGIQTVGAL